MSSLHNPNLFVLSGGPGSGKTTILAELANLGFHCAPEVARQIIQEQTKAGGTALPWNDRQAYADLMLQRSIEVFLANTPSVGHTFCDRGIPDTLGYVRLIGLNDTGRIENACKRYRYSRSVFVAPPWRDIYETDDERKQDFAEAQQTYMQMVEVYRELGYDPISIPRATPSARARFILEQLHLNV